MWLGVQPSHSITQHSLVCSKNISHVCFYLFVPLDSVPYLANSGHEIWDRRGDGGDSEWNNDDEARPTDSLVPERWSSATLKVLSSMPSRTIGGLCTWPVKEKERDAYTVIILDGIVDHVKTSSHDVFVSQYSRLLLWATFTNRGRSVTTSLSVGWSLLC